jgi:hypothetical protein
MKKALILVVILTGLGGLEARAMALREALSMIETGALNPQRSAADRIRGRSGEVSRYQIMPEVWRQYSSSTDYENPAIAWSVAQRILEDRTKWFRQQTGREPNALETYLLWNKPGHFHAAGFATSRVKPIYKERAQRFANLCTSV